MKLLPSLRQKKRYIAFEVQGATCSLRDVATSVNGALLQFLGEFGMAKAAPMLLKEKYKNNHFIVKVNHKYVDECKSALILIKKIGGKDVIVKSLLTSGTLKKVSGALK